MARIGLATSPLPRECSTTEPHGQAHIPKPMPNWSGCQTGAGEGNRTLVVSLENFCSTIELHPQRSPINNSPTTIHKTFNIKIHWWRGKDSNLRRQNRQIYSLIPLTAREPLQTEPAIMPTAGYPVKLNRLINTECTE